MRKFGTATVAAVLLLSACSGQMAAEKAKAPANMAHAHMGHVTTSWKDTPDKMGLLPTAMAEAKIAKQHATLVLQQPANLAWLKTHTGHVINAVDPSVEAEGPGLGYGVMKAAAGVNQHINLAAGSDGASGNVKAHAEHVGTSAQNTVDWARLIVALGQRVQASDNAANATVMVSQINGLADQLISGTDANKDGKVTWVKGEGGLGQSELHMGFMSKGEGLTN
ncbi:MAG: hypothetical protein HKN28_11945 [Alphaproteobacteria bacterium]|nr:hypothetical protein [Alphaproteobacteria bacterium]